MDGGSLVIIHELLDLFAQDLKSHLISALGLYSEGNAARCISYFAEEEDNHAEDRM